MLSISKLRYDQANGVGGLGGQDMDDHVICARLMDKGPLCGVYGPVAILISASGTDGSEMRRLSLSVLSLRTSLVVKKVDLGIGHTASVAVSPRAIVVVSLPFHTS